jgi:hypothetical protein
MNEMNTRMGFIGGTDMMTIMDGDWEHLMLLFACVFGSFGWISYHAIIGIIERFAG